MVYLAPTDDQSLLNAGSTFSHFYASQVHRVRPLADLFFKMVGLVWATRPKAVIRINSLQTGMDGALERSVLKLETEPAGESW